MKIERGKDQPEVLVKWYDYTKWVLDRVDGFPKNQRFVLGTRLADAAVKVLELLGEAAYAGKLAKLIGHGGKTTAFAVSLESGEVRLLEVVTTREGPKVGWDVYARHSIGSVSWSRWCGMKAMMSRFSR